MERGKGHAGGRVVVGTSKGRRRRSWKGIKRPARRARRREEMSTDALNACAQQHHHECTATMFGTPAAGGGFTVRAPALRHSSARGEYVRKVRRQRTASRHQPATPRAAAAARRRRREGSRQCGDRRTHTAVHRSSRTTSIKWVVVAVARNASARAA